MKFKLYWGLFETDLNKIRIIWIIFRQNQARLQQKNLLPRGVVLTITDEASSPPLMLKFLDLYMYSFKQYKYTIYLFINFFRQKF